MPESQGHHPTTSSPSGGDVAAGDGHGPTPNTDHHSPPSPRPQDGGTRSEATQGGTNPEGYRSARLLGSDHAELGEIAIKEITQNLAIGISRGRFPKGYAHLDPNEDAVFAATDGTTIVLVVADGHSGFDAARAAIEAIAEATPAHFSNPPTDIVRRLTNGAVEAVAGFVPYLLEPRDKSRTALTICAISDSILATTTLGDTACFVTTRRRTQRMGSPTSFLDASTDPNAVTIEELEMPLNGTITVTTDGLLDFASNPKRLFRSAAKHQTPDAVGDLIDAAFAGGAGDNVAVAVHRRP